MEYVLPYAGNIRITKLKRVAISFCALKYIWKAIKFYKYPPHHVLSFLKVLPNNLLAFSLSSPPSFLSLQTEIEHNQQPYEYNQVPLQLRRKNRAPSRRRRAPLRRRPHPCSLRRSLDCLFRFDGEIRGIVWIFDESEVQVADRRFRRVGHDQIRRGASDCDRRVRESFAGGENQSRAFSYQIGEESQSSVVSDVVLRFPHFCEAARAASPPRSPLRSSAIPGCAKVLASGRWVPGGGREKPLQSSEESDAFLPCPAPELYSLVFWFLFKCRFEYTNLPKSLEKMNSRIIEYFQPREIENKLK